MNPLARIALLQYVAITAPVFVPAVADAPQTMDRWQPHYVDRVPAKPRTIVYQPRTEPAPVFVTDVTIQPLTWQPTYPDRVLRRLVAQQSSKTDPPFQPPVVADTGGAIIATGSIKYLLQYQSVTGPFLESAAAVPDPGTIVGDASWRVVRRTGVHPSRMQAWAFDSQYTAPTAATVPDLQNPVLGQPRRPTYSRAVYLPIEPIFALPVPVPVMSWTGVYLDPPMRRRVRFQPEPRPFPLDFDTTINPPSPVLGWNPTYPSRILRRPSRHASLEPVEAGPLYIADVTVPVPSTGWIPQYPTQPPRRALLTAAQIAFFFDKFTAPTPAVVPDLAQAVYPNRVYGRRPLTSHPAYLGPLHVPDVTDPVPSLSWLAHYPDRLDRPVLPVSAHLSWTGAIFIVEFIPTPDIDTIDGQGSVKRRLFGQGSTVTTLRGRGSL